MYAICNVPLREPPTLGLKGMLTTQLLIAASVVPHALLAGKSVGLVLLNTSPVAGRLPVLLMVQLTAVEVTLTSTPMKSI